MPVFRIARSRRNEGRVAAAGFCAGASFFASFFAAAFARIIARCWPKPPSTATARQGRTQLISAIHLVWNQAACSERGLLRTEGSEQAELAAGVLRPDEMVRRELAALLVEAEFCAGDVEAAADHP